MNGCMDGWMLDLDVEGEARGGTQVERVEGGVQSHRFPQDCCIGTQFPSKLYGPGTVSSLYLGHELPGTTEIKSTWPLLPLALTLCICHQEERWGGGRKKDLGAAQKPGYHLGT